MDSIKKYLSNQDRKDWLVFTGIGVVVLLLAVFFIRNSAVSQLQVSHETLAEDNEVASTTQHISLKKYFTEQMNKKIESQGVEYIQAKENFEHHQKEAQSELDELKRNNNNLAEDLLRLKLEFEQSQQNSRANISIPTTDQSNNQHQMMPSHFHGDDYPDGFRNALDTPVVIDELETVSVALENTESSSDTSLHASDYVVSGTHIKGVLLGGIDAHTEVYGNNETRVVTIRMIEDGVMPNGFKAPLKNCVLLASAWGNASSERVVMRGERLSCIASKGQVFEQDIVGIVYGPDGREDVRGRVVYPEGKLVQRAFIAGSLSGLGSSVSENFVTKSVSPLGATATVNSGEMLGYSAAQGANKGLDKLADYYIKRAEKLQPIVQVPAGVMVDVVIQKGFSLRLAKPAKSINVLPESDPDSVKQAHAQSLDVLGQFSETYHD